MKLSPEVTRILFDPYWWTGDRVRRLRTLIQRGEAERRPHDWGAMLSRERFGELMGVSERTVYRWEQGESEMRPASARMLSNLVAAHLDKSQLEELLAPIPA